MIGVIGGVGPQAGVDFVQKILDNTHAVRDQDHLSVILVSCPSLIPDRSEFLLAEGDAGGPVNPAHGMAACARMLHAAGARWITVVCNTSHSRRIFEPFSREVAATMPGLEIVNQIATCAAHVRQAYPGLTRLGLLATQGTYASGVYRDYFSEAGIEILYPEERGRERTHEAIYHPDWGIKAGARPVSVRARNTLIHEIFRLAERGAEGVILGCTEIPLAVDPAEFGLPVIDPALITARHLIDLERGSLAGPPPGGPR